MKTYSNALELLTAARENLIYRGWGRTEMVHPVTGCVCALGAMTTMILGTESPGHGYYLFEEESENNDLYDPVAAEAVEALSDALPEGYDLNYYTGKGIELQPYQAVYRYNDYINGDYESTTQDDIIALYDRAIESLT